MSESGFKFRLAHDHWYTSGVGLWPPEVAETALTQKTFLRCHYLRNEDRDTVSIKYTNRISEAGQYLSSDSLNSYVEK